MAELIPYIEGVIWSRTKLNVKQVGEFSRMFREYFRADKIQKMHQFQYVSKELKDCFENFEPHPREVDKYFS